MFFMLKILEPDLKWPHISIKHLSYMSKTNTVGVSEFHTVAALAQMLTLLFRLIQ